MTESNQEPLDPALIGELKADFQRVGSGARERVQARLAGSIGMLSFNRVVPVEAPRPSPGLALRAHSLSVLASFVLGTVCGAGLYSALRPAPPARVLYVERPAPHAASSSTEPSVAVSAERATPTVSLSTKPSGAIGSAPLAPSASGARPGFDNLAEQQALLDVARSAFARSDYPATLSLLKTHAQRFPKSVLGEERAALEIKALAASGRKVESEARAARFATQFPQSLLLPSINDSLRANP
jgi:hypothetical protein